MHVPQQREDDAIRNGCWVVIAAYREATAIGAVVQGLREHGWRVVVVDDGSADATAAVARAAGATVVRHAVNLGQGAALRTGFAFALADPSTRAVVTFDADGQHAPEAVAALLAPLQRGEADATLGSRFLDPAATADVPPLRRHLLRLATRLARLTTGLPLTDTHNGLRGFTREALGRLTLTQDRMAHASEILSQLARHGLRVREVSVAIRYSEYSVAKGQRMIDAVTILWDLFLTRAR
ncbi:MAG: glycosyltransferase family 2 protein [Gemmatimonadales bacterium]|nr:glycosyltransferase family 2 protein [Gemmatimonadales bacterium]